LSLIDKVNREPVKRATARVVGIIKKFEKTYGGSILREEDMTEKTKNNLALYFK